MKRFLLSLACGILALGPTATGAATRECELDLSSTEARVETARCLKFQPNTSAVQEYGFPQKIAVGSFQIRYSLRAQKYAFVSPDSADLQGQPIDWDDEVYQDLTNRMYDRFVQRMEGAGIEVLPLDDVQATETYGRLETVPDKKEKIQQTRFTPYDMKLLKMQGMLRGAEDLPGINRELGTDAVVSVFAELSLCALTRKQAQGQKKPGAWLCSAETLNSQMFQNKSFLVWFRGGHTESRDPSGAIRYDPVWEGGIRKFADPPISYDGIVAPALKRRSLPDTELGELAEPGRLDDPELKPFADANLLLFDLLVELGMTRYRSQENR